MMYSEAERREIFEFVSENLIARMQAVYIVDEAKQQTMIIGVKNHETGAEHTFSVGYAHTRSHRHVVRMFFSLLNDERLL